MLEKSSTPLIPLTRKPQSVTCMFLGPKQQGIPSLSLCCTINCFFHYFTFYRIQIKQGGSWRMRSKTKTDGDVDQLEGKHLVYSFWHSGPKIFAPNSSSTSNISYCLPCHSTTLPLWHSSTLPLCHSVVQCITARWDCPFAGPSWQINCIGTFLYGFILLGWVTPVGMNSGPWRSASFLDLPAPHSWRRQAGTGLGRMPAAARFAKYPFPWMQRAVKAIVN